MPYKSCYKPKAYCKKPYSKYDWLKFLVNSQKIIEISREAR